MKSAILVTGAEKSKKVRIALKGDSPEMFPIRMVDAAEVGWLLDRAAAQQL